MGLGLRMAPSRSAMSTASRWEKSSRQLVDRLARKVESDSPVEIPGAPRRLVADLKTGDSTTYSDLSFEKPAQSSTL
jgi:hypothetical protein